MKHTTTDQLLEIADVKPAAVLTRRERLERWADLLEWDPSLKLRTLDGIEFQPKAQRPLMRADGSPLTVAYNDPVLRAAGLESDRLGDAMRFFELSEYQAHRVLCYCMHGKTVEGRFAANVVRSIARSHLTFLFPLAVLGAMALPTIFFVSHLLMKAA